MFSIQSDLPIVTTHKSWTTECFEFARFQTPRGAVDVFALLGFCAALVSSWLPTFRENI